MVNIHYVPQKWRGWELCEATLLIDRAVFIYKYVESEIYLVAEQLRKHAYISVFFEDSIDPTIETEVCMFENKLRSDADFHPDEVEFYVGDASDAYLYAGVQ